MPATDWKEVVAEGESARLEALAQRLVAMQRARAQKHPMARGLHAKGQAGVEATFEVLEGLPPDAKVGLFAQPATYRTLVRFSNGGGTRESDKKPDVRGVALKILGVPGRKIIPGMEDATTQDFLLIRTPAQPFSNPDDFIWLVEAAQSPASLPLKMLFKFGFGGGVKLLKQIVAGLRKPMTSVATTRYWTALPTRYGDFAAKYSLVPHEPEAPGAKAGTTPEHLAEELAARLAQGTVSYDFKVQFFKDEASTPIEDAAKEWLETDAPFITVARLTLAQQDLSSERGKRLAEWIENLSFDPWHALEEHRPLGLMMRARNHAYRVSTQERKAAPEPDESALDAIAA